MYIRVPRIFAICLVALLSRDPSVMLKRHLQRRSFLKFWDKKKARSRRLPISNLSS